MGNSASSHRPHGHSTNQKNRPPSLDLPDIIGTWNIDGDDEKTLNPTPLDLAFAASRKAVSPPAVKSKDFAGAPAPTIDVPSSHIQVPPTIEEVPTTQPAEFTQVTVMSILPTPQKVEVPAVRLEPITITWNGPGKAVFVAMAGDDDWKGRKELIQDPKTLVHSITIPLHPGTHHFRFLVDDQWLVADDIPTAVDDQGSLANYVAVRLDDAGLESSPSQPTISPTLNPTPPRRPPHSDSFWRTSSTSNGNDEVEESYRGLKRPDLATRAGQTLKHSAKWRSVIPPELISASQQDEAYRQSLADQVQAGTAGRGRRSGQPVKTTGFIPRPLIPEPPNLPRHLHKLILNTRTYPGGATKSGTETVVGASGGGRSVLGGLGGGGRDREGRDRDSSMRRSGGSRRGERDRVRDYRRSGPLSPLSNDDLASPPSPEQHSFVHANATAANPAGGLIDDTVAADDNSVLPVPSHAVLHHVSTCAVKNNVLALAATVRYHDKYMTIVYYKDMES